MASEAPISLARSAPSLLWLWGSCSVSSTSMSCKRPTNPHSFSSWPSLRARAFMIVSVASMCLMRLAFCTLARTKVRTTSRSIGPPLGRTPQCPLQPMTPGCADVVQRQINEPLNDDLPTPHHPQLRQLHPMPGSHLLHISHLVRRY